MATENSSFKRSGLRGTDHIRSDSKPAWRKNPVAGQGERLFSNKCTICHGLDANGKVPKTPVLLQPMDLTQLQHNNNGEFPLTITIKKIDGRDPLVSHGSPMPIYGDFFKEHDVSLKRGSGQPIMTSQPIADLAV
ncbi:MAG: cytochrome c [Rhodobacterales bacterium]|nr:cytochrome c [Rhodobacterales bacterium]